MDPLNSAPVKDYVLLSFTNIPVHVIECSQSVF